jgi:hypothetical protein
MRTAGNVNTNQAMILMGVSPNNIIWDLQGASGNVLSTSGGNLLYGTFLDTMGGDFQFSSLNLTGQLINTDGHIQFVSNSKLTGDPFAPIPEASSWILMLAGVGALGAMLRSRRGPSVPGVEGVEP